MSDTLETAIKSLPPLPSSLSELNEICNDPNAGIGRLTAIVQKDPMLTANLLKAANSPLYGFSREINSVTQAVSLFGMATVKGFAIASSVKNTLKINLSPYGISIDDFSNISQLHNKLMTDWYKTVDPKMLDTLSPASFLLGVGKIVISDRLINSGKDAEFTARLKELGAAAQAEKEFFGIAAAGVSSMVFDHWKFDTDLVQAIKYSDDYKQAPENIRAYALALNAIRVAVPFMGGISDESIEQSALILAENEMDTKAFKALLSNLQRMVF